MGVWRSGCCGAGFGEAVQRMVAEGLRFRNSDSAAFSRSFAPYGRKGFKL